MSDGSFEMRRRAVLFGALGSLIVPAAARGRDLSAALDHPALGPSVTPEMFGAMGAGGDDTAGLRAMVDAINRRGRGHIVFTPGKTYLLSHDRQLTLHFQNLDGLLIEGTGAVLKTADRGCPTSSLGANWGQINIDNCRNVQVLGLTLDGNRAGQLHTRGAGDAYGINFGLNFWTAASAHTTGDVQIRNCVFKDHGTLGASGDIRGDAIFAVSGIERMWIENCVFRDVGRWAFALAEGAEPSQHIYFRHNRVLNGDRLDSPNGNRPWGAVDIEDMGLANKHIYIEDNLFVGTAQISYGGYSSSGGPFDVVVEDTFIRRNTWRIPAGANAANVPWSIGFSLPGTRNYREFRRLYIEDNVVEWAGAANTTHFGHTSKMRDAFLRRNRFVAARAAATTDAGLYFAYGGHIEGRIEISDNEFVGLGEAIKSPATFYEDPSPESLELLIERNSFDRCFRAFNLQFNGCAAPPRTSRIVMRNNRTTNTRSPNGEYLDGGEIGIDLYNRSSHDKVWNHLNVAYRA